MAAKSRRKRRRNVGNQQVEPSMDSGLAVAAAKQEQAPSGPVMDDKWDLLGDVRPVRRVAPTLESEPSIPGQTQPLPESDSRESDAREVFARKIELRKRLMEQSEQRAARQTVERGASKASDTRSNVAGPAAVLLDNERKRGATPGEVTQAYRSAAKSRQNKRSAEGFPIDADAGLSLDDLTRDPMESMQDAARRERENGSVSLADAFGITEDELVRRRNRSRKTRETESTNHPFPPQGLTQPASGGQLEDADENSELQAVFSRLRTVLPDEQEGAAGRRRPSLGDSIKRIDRKFRESARRDD